MLPTSSAQNIAGTPGEGDTAEPGTTSGQIADESSLAATTTFQIVPEESEARFTLGEVLLGKSQSVVGATQQLSGEITVDSNNPGNSTVGVIEIDAGSLVTDNDRRNAAVHRFILQTDQYPQITFTPTALSGMPASVAVGDTVNFQLTGDLQIRDIVNAVTFDVTVKVVSATELTGSAQASVLRSSFDLAIPNVPSVTDVSEDVELVFDFTARAI